jgi:hypothetical protein
VVLTGRAELTPQEQAEVQALIYSPDVAATVTTRTRIVLWRQWVARMLGYTLDHAARLAIEAGGSWSRYAPMITPGHSS